MLYSIHTVDLRVERSETRPVLIVVVMSGFATLNPTYDYELLLPPFIPRKRGMRKSCGLRIYLIIYYL